MLIHPEVLAVLEQTFLCPPVDQVVRFGGAAVGPASLLFRKARLSGRVSFRGSF